MTCRFVKSKREDRHVMDLYAAPGPLDLDELRSLCRKRKGERPADAFYFLVVFDAEANARFPTNPLTAEFGHDEGALRHIRAVYVYNRLNGFSELRHYDTNEWEGKVTLEKL